MIYLMNTLTQLTGTIMDTGGTQQMIDSIITNSNNTDSVSQMPSVIIATLWSVNNNMIFYVVIFLWILVIIRIIKDSNYRSHSTWFVILSLLLVTLWTPVLGLPIYLAIRPLGYKYERSYWKAIMTQEDEELLEEQYEVKTLVDYNSDMDRDHLAELKKQATVSKARVTRSSKEKQTSKKVVSSSPKSKNEIIPNRRSAPTRTKK